MRHALQIPHPDPGSPDSGSPLRYLWWTAARRPYRAAYLGLLTTLVFVGLAVPSLVIGRIVDEGLQQRDWTALTAWSAVLVGIGALSAGIIVVQHRAMTFLRLDAAYRTVSAVTRHMTRLGSALPRKVSTGEIVNVGGADIRGVADAMSLVGGGVAGIGFLAVTAVLLFGISPLLGAVILFGMPLVVVAVGPLLGRLQRRSADYRRRQGELTSRAGDIVAGLRVLRGVGGEDQFYARYRDDSRLLQREGYRVGAAISWVRSLEVGIPGLFLAVIVWLAARQAVSGTITIGEMVAVNGYAMAMTIPLVMFMGSCQQFIAGLVAAKRVIAVLNLNPDLAEPDLPVPGPDGPADLRDPESGLVVSPGQFVVLAAAEPGQALATVDRLGRYVDSDVRYGDVKLSAMDFTEVRRRIAVADNDAYLFAGALREAVTAAADLDAAAVATAIHVAAADDVVDSLRDGLDAELDNQARTLSGGQRQRLRLARAVAAAPEVLIAVDPTSAVDAHTEATVAERLREHRRGRTTLVTTLSPLFLAHADVVAWLVDGKVVDVGAHKALLSRRSDYRAAVTRDTQEADDE